MENLTDCLELANGTILEDSSCGYSERYLWCWIYGKTMSECYELFSNPENIKYIRYHLYTERVTYTGFTDMLLIQKREDEKGEMQIAVRLTWPEGGSHTIETETLPDDE